METWIDVVSNMGSTSLIVAAACILGKYVIEEKTQDKNNYREDIAKKEEQFRESLNVQQEVFIQEIVATRTAYKEELAKDREVYTQSITSILSQLDEVKQDVQDIKKTLDVK